jgi:hypothetical protein
MQIKGKKKLKIISHTEYYLKEGRNESRNKEEQRAESKGH